VFDVRYSVTLDDIVTFNLHVTRRWAGYRWPKLLMTLMFFCASITIPIQELRTRQNPFIVAIFACFAVVGTYLFWKGWTWFEHWWTRLLVGSLGRKLTGPWRLTLTDENITVETPASTSIVRWEKLEQIEILKDLTLLYTSGMSAILLPQKGFQDPAEYEAIRDFALARYQALTTPNARENTLGQ
jgi:hypothetical protein